MRACPYPCINEDMHVIFPKLNVVNLNHMREFYFIFFRKISHQQNAPWWKPASRTLSKDKETNRNPIRQCGESATYYQRPRSSGHLCTKAETCKKVSTSAWGPSSRPNTGSTGAQKEDLFFTFWWLLYLIWIWIQTVKFENSKALLTPGLWNKWILCRVELLTTIISSLMHHLIGMLLQHLSVVRSSSSNRLSFCFTESTMARIT